MLALIVGGVYAFVAVGIFYVASYMLRGLTRREHTTRHGLAVLWLGLGAACAIGALYVLHCVERILNAQLHVLLDVRLESAGFAVGVLVFGAVLSWRLWRE